MKTFPPIPSGPGLVQRRVRIAPPDIVVLGGILAGYEGLASIHGDDRDEITLVTTESRAAELDSLLGELAFCHAIE